VSLVATYVVEPDVLEVLEECAENVGVTIQSRYSGRGMYGGTCLAVTTDHVSGLVRFVIALVSATNSVSDELAERVSALVDELELTSTREDQLGRGRVYYWPYLEVTT
jgi:hypothetical protein